MPAGCATTVARLVRTVRAGVGQAVAVPQREFFAAALQFARGGASSPPPSRPSPRRGDPEALVARSPRSRRSSSPRCPATATSTSPRTSVPAGAMLDFELSDDEVAAAMADVP